MKKRYVMYVRKSTDSEDRQVQSIEDQLKVLHEYAKERNLKVVKVLKESMSAKNPGRPEFNKMIGLINHNEVDGILCWKINRLSRNPIDGGQIQWLLQTSVITSIQTPGKEYRTADNTLVMSVELGMANQFSIDLSTDVKRGMRLKAEKGWRPGLAPLGYVNDKFSEKGSKKILVDEETFPLVKGLWDLMLTGRYSLADIGNIANEKLGLRTKYRNSKKISTSHIYRMFSNSFYYGEYMYMGDTFTGKHKPMITPEEYDQVQRILGKSGKPRPKSKTLPYRGVIKCGYCGSAIVADEKVKKNKTNSNVRTYVYFRCMHHRKDIVCTQKAISELELDKQIFAELEKIALPEKLLSFALKVLRGQNEIESETRTLALQKQYRALERSQKNLDNLLNIYISQENEDREILTDEEFKSRKLDIIKEKAGVQVEIKHLELSSNEWMELTEKTFRFATYAKYWFLDGNKETKTTILKALGSNFILKDQKITLSLAKYLLPVAKKLTDQNFRNSLEVELATNLSNKRKTASFETVSLLMSG